MLYSPREHLEAVYDLLEKTPIVLGADVGRPHEIYPAIVHSTHDFTDVKVSLGDTPERIVEGNVHYPLKLAAGADADGNRRGVSSYWVDTENSRILYVEPHELLPEYRGRLGLTAIQAAAQESGVDIEDVRFGGVKSESGTYISAVGLINQACRVAECAKEQELTFEDTTLAYWIYVNGLTSERYITAHEAVDRVSF